MRFTEFQLVRQKQEANIHNSTAGPLLGGVLVMHSVPLNGQSASEGFVCINCN